MWHTGELLFRVGGVSSMSLARGSFRDAGLQGCRIRILSNAMFKRIKGENHK